MVRRTAAWRWSSYRALMGKAPVPPWLDAGWTLGQFGKVLSKARTAYAAFVEDGIGAEAPSGAGTSRGQTPGRVPPGRVPDD